LFKHFHQVILPFRLARCEIPLNQKPLLKLDPIHSGFAARCEYRLKNPLLKLDPIHSGFAARCEYRLKNPLLKLDPIHSGFAAQCEYRLKSPLLKLDPIHSGFAARCEAGLCPAVSLINLGLGYAPRSGYAHK